jgi:hypothetical protein
MPVQFNDKVEVRLMDVNLEEHANEIKNPKDFMQIIPDPTMTPTATLASAPLAGNANLAILIIILIITMALVYTFARRARQSTSKAIAKN